MPKIKIKDHSPTASNRRGKIWEIIGVINAPIYKLNETSGGFFAIGDDNSIEKLCLSENKEIFRNNSFEILNPPELNARKTVVVRGVDRQIADYTAEEIAANIASSNNWASVEEAIKLPGINHILKVRFTSIDISKQCLSRGIKILNQFIPSNNIDEEIHIQLRICFRCYQYDHTVQNCPHPKELTRCSECASHEHTFKTCDRTNIKKCLNCEHDNDHRTLAAKCPLRKKLIKEETRRMREEVKQNKETKAQNQDTRSYANAARKNIKEIKQNLPTPSDIQTNLQDNTTTIILSALIYSQMMERVEPGTFQQNMDFIYSQNNLTPVKFPEKRPDFLPLLLREVTLNCDGKIVTEADLEETRMEDEEINEAEIQSTIAPQQTHITEHSRKRDRDTTSPPAKKSNIEPEQDSYALTELTPKQRTYSLQSIESNTDQTRNEQATGTSHANLLPSKVKLQEREAREHQVEMKLEIFAPSNLKLPQNISNNKIIDLLHNKEIKYVYHNKKYQESEVWKLIASGLLNLKVIKPTYLDPAAFKACKQGLFQPKTKPKAQTASKP